MKLKDLGFDNWFADQIEKHHIADVSPARVAAVDKNSYMVRGDRGEAQAELSGKMIFDTQSTLDYPAVGDWVAVQYYNDDTFAIVHDVLKRKTLLSRKTSGKQISHQLIAANIDVALIMQSVDANFNLRRLERYLVMAQEGGITPVITLSKTDLISESELSDKIEQIRRFNEKYRVLAFSSLIENGVENVKEMIEPGKTYCLLGSSGVGKTTLLNSLLGREAFQVQDVRAGDGKGRHTTTRRQLTMLDQGGIFIDTPGMRELGVFGIEGGLSDTFEDILSLAEGCKYSDCTHTKENGCAVISALESGELDEKRYENYMKMKKESAYYEMSYLEKRRRDKSFGKMVKEVKKIKGMK